MLDNRMGRFCCEALTPMLCRESPAYFDSRHKCGLKRRNREPDKTDKSLRRIRLMPQVHCKEAEAVVIKVVFQATNQSVGCIRRQQFRHKLHYPRIGIHLS